jgi:hypothetical protein
MSLLKAAEPAYLLAPRHQLQAEENAAMLREFNRIAREMLFMHGHLTRPTDWAESAGSGRRTPVEPRPAKRQKRRRLAMAVAACCVVPTRLIGASFR